MRKFKRFFSGWVCFIVGFLMFNSLVYAQQIPRLIKYAGNLKELIEDKKDVKEEKQEKEADKEKFYALTFRIYNSETGGIVLWRETHQRVMVKNGEFEVVLGSINPLDLRFDADYWLSIEIGNRREKGLREKMTSFGYAYMSEDSYKLGGRYPDDFALSGHSHLGEDIVTAVSEAINADMVDGLHADQIGGIRDHGALEGLADDDHLQYLNILRADERYAGAGWDGLTRLKTAQEHIANKNNPHTVTLEQLGHLDNNPEEEAPMVTERGEPTGTEIQEWADDITAWGHSNVVTNLNADKLDGKDSSEFSLIGHLHTLTDISDITFDLRAAFLAAGTAGANGSNRLVTMSDIPLSSGLWTNGGAYIYPNNAKTNLQIKNDTGDLIIGDNIDVSLVDPTIRALFVHRNNVLGQFMVDADSVGVQSISNHPLYLKTNDITRVAIDTSGNVGIGTTSPGHTLDVRGTGIQISVFEHHSIDFMPPSNTPDGWQNVMSFSGRDGFAKAYIYGDNRYANESFLGFQASILTLNGNVGIRTTNPQGALDVNGAIYQRGALLHADYVFEPDYKLETIEEHSRFMWQEKHLKAVPKASKTEDDQDIVEVGARNKGVLEELEKAHVYIAQLNERLKQLEAKLAESSAQ